MEADVLNALKTRIATLPGGRDHDGNLLIIFQLPYELQPWTKRYLELSIKYLLASLSQQTLNNGLIAIVDAQKCSWRLARDQIRHITQLLDKNLIKLIALRSEAFSVQNCAKSYKKGEPIIISKSRLNKYFDLSELPTEIGGTQIYQHDQWIENRVKIEDFRKTYEKTLNSIDGLQQNLADSNTMRASEIEQTIKICNSTNSDVQKSIKSLLDNGNILINHINEWHTKEPFVSQDVIDAKEQIKTNLNEIEKKQTEICFSWNELEKSLDDAKDFSQLEDGVSYVTNWILSTAESLLNGQLKIGYDVQSSEKLRLDHEILEFQCWKTYGFYGELLYKIDSFPGKKDTFAYKDLLSQRDFMDFVCRSFATRLERRRNVLITSARFYRLVAEYFQRTSSVFESLLMAHKDYLNDFELAKVKLQKIKDSQQSLGNIEKELVKEGEKLSDILSMPVKDALGRDIDVDYSEDIANLRDVLDATKARFKIFSDSMDLQKLTLEQITHIHAYEEDADIAVKWVESLFKVMLKSHTHVGCNVHEIQSQKDEHQAFQETAKSTFNYGCQLLNAAYSLRQSCKLNSDKNLETIEHLKKSWKTLHVVNQEQMTRLRVSAVFYRSVDEHCTKLEQLKVSVFKLREIPERERKIMKLRKYLASRERLLVEVGRMVRLGRLLRTRLKEPFVLDNQSETMSSEDNFIANAENTIACDAISEKLIEVSRVAESLDGILHDTQDGLDIFECTLPEATTSVTTPVTTTTTTAADRKASYANTSDDWSCSMKSSTEDESFVTASECTPSRSSSYHTASECRASPWWQESAERSSIDLDSEDTEQPSMQLLVGTTSSANVSFDDSETSFRSPVSFEQTDSDNTTKVHNDSENSSPTLPPKVSSPVDEISEIIHENKIYTIFESPTSTPSQDHDDDECTEGDVNKNGDLLHIKVADLIPKFTFLGRNLDEALKLQKQHEELLLNIQNLPTPLEEFYRKIQEKIASNEKQNPRLIEDMADSLNKVWGDIQRVLHDRRLVISLNVIFFEKLGECYGKMSSLEVACRDTMIPIEVEAVRDFLEKFKILRIEVLASIINPLTIGNQLLEKLKDVVAAGSLDSRPNQILEESKKSVNTVELWLEDLSDKRNNLETAWLNRKIQLEQCLALAQLSKDLTELEKILNKQRDEILGTFTLGDNKKHAESMLQDYGTWRIDAIALRDRSIKITKTTEEIVKKGGFTGDEACAKAYSVLSGCTEYLDEIDLREQLLARSSQFFSKAENVLKRIDNLEHELKSICMRPGSPNIIPIHIKLLQEVNNEINDVLEYGYSLIDEVGRTKPEVMGVKTVVDTIENRKIYLENNFSATSEKHFKVSEQLNKFLEEYNDIFSWIEYQKREKIINGSMNYMGNNTHQAKECLYLHQQLLQDIEIKDDEIKNLKHKFNPHMEFLEDSQRDDVNEKIKLLVKNWSDLRDFIGARIPLIELYIKFHLEAEHLTNLFNNLEQTLKTTIKSNDFHYIDTVWNKIQTQYTMLKTVAKMFTAEKSKVAEPYLQVDRAANCIEKTLDDFSSRQLEISDVWENWNIRNEVHILIETIMAENVETLTLTAKIEQELYPILATSEELPSELIRFVEIKLKTVLNEIHEAERELSQRIEKIDKLEAKDQVSSDKIVQVKNNLNSIKTKLFGISADYNDLVDVILVFLQNYHDIYEGIRDYFSAKEQQPPMLADNVEGLIKDYESFKNNTMEHFRNLLAQSEKIIDRIKMQEPPGAKEQDTDKIITLLEKLRIFFETNASSENSELKRQHFIREFEKMCTDLNDNMANLQVQYNDIHDKYGESAAAAKVCSLSFEYFERNVDLLNKRIENFISSYRNSQNSYPDTQPYIDGELHKLQQEREEFIDKIRQLKHALSLAQQYYNLLEIIESRYHKTYTFLVNSANLKKADLRTSESAFELINEIENYVIENKQTQIDDLQKLSTLSQQLFGIDKTENLYADNIFIFQSFEKIKSDIVDIVKDLKDKEDPIALINEIDKNILVIESSEESHRIENIHEIIPMIGNEPPRFLTLLQSSEVNEKDRFVFECFVQGYPEPTVQWLKYNVPIKNGPNYNCSYDAGRCQLEINEIQTSDAAVFSCIASNIVGTSQTTANLIVKEIVKEETELAPPTFIKLLQNSYATERASFQFNCLVAGNPLPTVQWFKNDRCIDSLPDYGITYNNGYAVLKIDKTKIDDQGTYTCRASNQLGNRECNAVLSVESLEVNEQPIIQSQLSNVMARVGQKIKLECDISGNPKPELYWMHNGKQFTGRDVKLQYVNDKVTLIIDEAFLKDAGTYTLTARNNFGEATTECNVVVKGLIPVETSDSEVASDLELIKPSVQLSLKDISVFEGKTVRLDCIIVGQPEPEVIWYHDQRPVKESTDIQLLFQGDRCTLFIQEAFTEDAGEYKVVAINSAGEASSQCQLSVTPLNLAEPLIRPSSDKLLSSEMPPKFEKLLTDQLAIEGETVELECCLASLPIPEIQWYLNNKEITYDDRIRFVARDDGILKLVIQNVLPDDKGVYTIKATSTTGVAKCFSHLIVKSTANNGDAQNGKYDVEEKQICPTFKELFGDRAVNWEDSTKFECIVFGKPTPKVKWFFNDEPIHGRNFLVSTSGERQVLAIPSVTQQNVGKISCIAENEIGKATCVAFLTLDTQGVPQNNQEQFTTQEDLSGSSLITMQKHITTTTTTKQSNNFGNGVPQSQFHSTSSQFDSSFKKVGDAPPVITETKKMEEIREGSIEPTQTFAEKLISFTKNDTTDKHESIIAHSGQISTGKPVRRNIAPRFVSPLIGKIVDQGVDVTLEGIVDGYPAPNIEITKNGEELKNIEGVSEYSYNLNKISIKMYNVSVKDAGRYSCVATNDAGSATSTADLVVKKSIFPPVFGRRLQAQVAKKGERVLMDVEITGTPEPKVSWFKDDRPLEQVLTSEFRLTEVGNCYKLIIENAKLQDSGKFMVKATNSGGEAQSIADFMVLENQPDRMVEITKTTVFSDISPEQIRKSDPIDQVKVPVTNGKSNENYSAHQELTAQSQIGGSTEHTVITESVRTTAATMRMEHKSSYHDLPSVMFSQRTQTPAPNVVSSGTETDSETKKQSEFTQTPMTPLVQQQTKPVDFPYNPIHVPIQLNPEPIKQNAFEFFENNLKNLPPLTEEKYTRFDDLKNKTYSSKHIEVNQQFKTQLVDDLSQFNLQPGSPPEMGFMPKEPQAAPEKIVDKVKKLEQAHSQATEVPLPQSFKREERFEKKEFKSSSTNSSVPFVPQPIAPQLPVLTLPEMPTSNLPQSPAMSYLPNINRDKLFTDPKFMRSASPKPSMEAVNMEKLWAQKPKTPEPFSNVSQQQQNFTHEHKSSFVAYTSSQQQSNSQQQQQQFITPQEHFLPIQVDTTDNQEQEMPKLSIKETKNFFEQRIKQEEMKSTPADLKAPGLVKQFAKPEQKVLQDVSGLGLEPGAPPEMCYAPKQTLERQQSYREKIEKSLELNMEREPDHIPRGGVRLLPAQRQTPQRTMYSQSPQRTKKSASPQPIMKPVQTFVPPPVVEQPPPIVKQAPIVLTPAELAPQIEQFSSQEFRSEKFEMKKEMTSSGYRHVAPPMLESIGKSMEPTAMAPMPFVLPPVSYELPPMVQPEPMKTAYVPVKKPDSIWKPEPVKPFVQQPMHQPKPIQIPVQLPIQQPIQQPLYQPKTMQQPIQQPMYQPQPQQPKQIVKPKAKFPTEFIAETHQTHSLYKNFVKSEQNTHTTESYFRQIDSPNLSQTPLPQQQQIKKQEPPKQQFKPQPPQTNNAQQEYKTTQVLKNISMTSKQIKFNEEPMLEQMPYTAEPVQMRAKVPPPPSPSRFVKGEFRGSDYESDYDGKMQQMWRSSSVQSDRGYKSVNPNLTQSHQKYPSNDFQSPPPPSAFDQIPQYSGPSRPKFEPIEKPKQMQQQTTKKVEVNHQKVFKPTPVKNNNVVEKSSQSSNQSSNQSKSYYFTSGPQTTTYYTGVAGQPVHNAIAHETSNTMHMKESSEKSSRVVNITQTRRVISLDNSKEEAKLEPFPYAASPDNRGYRQRVPPPPTPTKFVPGEYRESDYDSELEGTRIRPVWTPNQSDNDELHYRRVRPPSQQSRSSSVPRSYERVMTPMEFDTQPVKMPTRIRIESPSLKNPQQYFTSSLYRDQIQTQTQTLDRSSTKKYQSSNVTRDDIDVQTRYAPQPTLIDHASNQINSMNNQFKTKAHQFMKDVIIDQNKTQKPILKKANSVSESSNPQAYRNESRVSEYGTRHVDPDTGIIYFKYDFGYEFGIIFPGEGKKIVGGIRNGNQKTEKSMCPRLGDIEVPVHHEKSNGRQSTVSFGTTTPIEFEADKTKKRYSLPTANYYDRMTPKSGIFQTSDYSMNNFDRSRSGTPSIVNQQKQSPPKHPPMFITPLKDIAVVSGQTARFECIVQCDPHPSVMWLKNGQVLENNHRNTIEFRNGVCRLTIPQSYPDDAGTYECVAQNPLGNDSTRAILIIPGDKRSTRRF